MPSHSLFRGTKLYEKLISNNCYNGRETFDWVTAKIWGRILHSVHTKNRLKVVFGMFLIFILFHQKKALKNDKKCFLFHVKSSFCSRGIKFFKFPPSPHFYTVGRYRRSWLKITFKFDDVIKCLSRNFKIDIDGYLGK